MNELQIPTEQIQIPRRCSSCLSSKLFLGIDLGELPISNELKSISGQSTEFFQLQLFVCQNCSLGQAPSNILPDRLFSDYRYLSSVSSTFVAHAHDFCQEIVERGLIKPGELILEIACNDGYLLKNFLGSNIEILGVEPAKNVSKIAESIGIPVINEFFGAKLAREILSIYGYPKLIIANNVLAHVPDIRDFMEGLSILSGPTTKISVENPSILNILRDNQFDTIYHEHFSYLSCTSVDYLAKEFGLVLFDLNTIDIHGGSNRYWLAREISELSQSLINELAIESSAGVSDKESWKVAESRKNDTLIKFSNWLEKCRLNDEAVIGYGAAAKASTLLNAAGVDKTLVSMICDLGSEKVGRFMPSEDFEIIDFSSLIARNPENIIVFPWNIADEISSQISKSLPDAKIWVAIPELKRIR
jgi:hypothetical protein